MSRENVEKIERAIDAFDRRDMDSLAPLITEDFEWAGAFMGSVEGGSFRGREGMERFFAEAADTWEEFRSVAEEYRDLGDRVLVLGRLEGRGKASGVVVDTPFSMICDFRGGKVSRTRAYLDRAEALKAVGLEE